MFDCCFQPAPTSLKRALALAIVLVQPLLVLTAQDQVDANPIQRLTYSDPIIRLLPPKKQMVDGYLPVWKAALKHGESDLRRQLAAAIVVAHSEKYRDLTEFIPVLQTTFDDESLPMAARIDVARALVALDAKSSGPKLQKWLGKANTYDRIVLPALAKWNAVEFVDRWQTRAQDTTQPATHRVLLLRCLGVAIVTSPNAKLDNDSLAKIVKDKNEFTAVRAAAAATLSAASDEAAIELATQLLNGNQTVSYVLAAKLLSDCDANLTQNIDQQLAASKSGAVARGAWQRLLNSNPQALTALAPDRISHNDSLIRQLAIGVLAKSDSPERLDLISSRMADRHQDVRARATNAIIQLAKDQSLRTAAIEKADTWLDSDDWRAQEQAIIVLAKLDVESSYQRFLELLRSRHDEVALAAAWGLREIGAKNAMRPMLEWANQTEQRVKSGGTDAIDDLQLAYIFESFGQQKFRLAEGLLRHYVPKTRDHFPVTEARAAAIWSLGQFYAGTKDDILTNQLIQRLNDTEGMMPELEQVRYASSIALGRIGSSVPVADLKKYNQGTERIAFGCAWAISKITGKEFISPPAIVRGRTWFLMPLDELKDSSKK